MIRLALIALLTLTACGADGPPVPPGKSGVTLTGEARIGISS